MRRGFDVNQRLMVTWLLALLAGACSLTLDTSIAGHRCGENHECLPGYKCNAQDICVLADKAACDPACSAVEACIQQQCIPVCEGRACPSGSACENGVCKIAQPATSMASQNLGTTCSVDADCGGSLFCVIPYGGHSVGFCSQKCTDDMGCSANAAFRCLGYQSDSQIAHVCAPPSFLACQTDAECAPSGLSCGVYSGGSTPANSLSLMACRSQIAGGAAAGAGCNAMSCTSGLCIQQSANDADRVCTVACKVDADCSTFAAGTKCEPVTVGGADRAGVYFPFVRANVCVPRGDSYGVSCSANADVCTGNAPDCVMPVGSTQSVCAPRCSDHIYENPDQRCRVGHCQSIGLNSAAASYCVGE